MSDATDAALDLEIRRATHDDYDAVVGFTSDIWADRGGDYIPDIYHDWLEADDETGKKTFLAAVEGEAVGIVQAVMLTPDEAWFQGIRVAADYRGRGVSHRLNEACFEWARAQGATVARVMIFSWNTVSVGAARASGYEPITEFRFAHPTPDSDAEGPQSVSSDPTAAWRYWTHSDTRTQLSGLGLAPEESWAIREITRDDFERFADETAVFAVESEDGLAGAAYRSRTFERDVEDESGDSSTETWAEYGVGAWDDATAGRSLFAAIARDAAACGADQTRVLIPETARSVSDAAYAGVELAEEPDFVLGIDLTAH
ncbi:GNAT family N-acetyltransferase [Natronorubrum bangense]|uniref:GCN5-like N-acetyltransferase n=2 Tax=Natronorubrum bangense TaxID=61858 RepID=L9WPZ5_9EURY|nr:GNAT family N-acetyltransferase [Natronorubrum bangense]ELY51462.1 GCN5-like N-acetyltransferase [Natronorubrum bangense JCM 10635]QCC54574.1 GNAT family N-acetyltransferase [Natronorubrum bangense]